MLLISTSRQLRKRLTKRLSARGIPLPSRNSLAQQLDEGWETHLLLRQAGNRSRHPLEGCAQLARIVLGVRQPIAKRSPSARGAHAVRPEHTTESRDSSRSTEGSKEQERCVVIGS